MSFAHWAFGCGLSPGKLWCIWFPHPSLCVMKGLPCENVRCKFIPFSVFAIGQQSGTALQPLLCVLFLSSRPAL